MELVDQRFNFVSIKEGVRPQPLPNDCVYVALQRAKRERGCDGELCRLHIGRRLRSKAEKPSHHPAQSAGYLA